jgi:FkbM family methyltransferase
MLPHFLNYRELETYDRIFVCMSHPVSWEIMHKLYFEAPWKIGGCFGVNQTLVNTTIGMPFYDLDDAPSFLTSKDVVIVFYGKEIRALKGRTDATLLHGELLPLVISSNELAGFLWFVNRHQPKGCCLDIGANWGINTGILADKAESIYAFEPLKKFHSNAALFKFSAGRTEIHHIQKAVGDFTGEIEIRTFGGKGEDHFNSTIVSDDQVGREAINTVEFSSRELVSITTIDEFCLEHKLEPAFIKVDVEGAESKVLKGARATIEKYKPVLFLEMPTGFFIKDAAWNEEIEFLDRLYNTLSIPSIGRALPDFSPEMSLSEFFEIYGEYPLNCGFLPK